MSTEWVPLPIKRVADISLGKMIQPVQKSHTDVQAPYLRAAHVQPHGEIANVETKQMWFSPSELQSNDLRAGDVVVVEGGAGFGRSAYLDDDLEGWSFQNSIIRIRARSNKSVGSFINYAIQAALRAGEIEISCNAATFQHFTAEKVSAFKIPAPAVHMQQTVVEYLDRETAEIDAFIADQKELISFLGERRTATISWAVTQGLNPDTPMKDSGIEWLGEVPSHWIVTTVRNLYSVLDCKHITAEFSDDGKYPLASIREVQSPFVDLRNAKRTTKEFYEALIADGRKPLAGDLIISRNATVGKVALVGLEHPAFAMGQDVSLIRARSTTQDSRFLQFVLQSGPGVAGMAVTMVGSTFKRINVADIKSLYLAVPPPAEQLSILAYLNRETTEIDAGIAEARVAIALSKERRAAVISAAVTGKIDVRGASAPATNKVEAVSVGVA